MFAFGGEECDADELGIGELIGNKGHFLSIIVSLTDYQHPCQALQALHGIRHILVNLTRRSGEYLGIVPPDITPEKTVVYR